MLLLGTPYSVVGGDEGELFRGGIMLWGLKRHVFVCFVVGNIPSLGHS